MTDDRDARRQERLAEVCAQIADHPLSAAPMREARDVVAELRGESRAVVEAALERRGLPSTGRQTRAMLTGLASLARLNRRRIRLERGLASGERTDD